MTGITSPSIKDFTAKFKLLMLTANMDLNIVSWLLFFLICDSLVKRLSVHKHDYVRRFSRVKICPEVKILENNSDPDSGLRSASRQHSLVVREAIVTERRWFEPHFLCDCV